jgi:hypothetical protein
MEEDPASKCNFIEIQMIDKVQKTDFTDYNAPLSEPFGLHLISLTIVVFTL